VKSNAAGGLSVGAGWADGLINRSAAERYKFDGYDIIIGSPHASFGRATYVHSVHYDVSVISTSDFCDAVQMGGFKFVSVYKPLSAQFMIKASRKQGRCK